MGEGSLVGGEVVVAEVFWEHFSPAATQAIYWDSLRYWTPIFRLRSPENWYSIVAIFWRDYRKFGVLHRKTALSVTKFFFISFDNNSQPQWVQTSLVSLSLLSYVKTFLFKQEYLGCGFFILFNKCFCGPAYYLKFSGIYIEQSINREIIFIDFKIYYV